MTPISLDRFVLDAGPLAQSPCGFDTQRLVLRTAIHCGVRWIWCPDAAAQRLAGRALFDLRGWRAAIAIDPEFEADGLRLAAARLRRERIDLAILSNLSARASLSFVRAEMRGDLGALGAVVDSAPALVAALRAPRFSHVSLGPGFDAQSVRDPAIRAALAARPGATCFAPAQIGYAPLRGGVVFAPAGPHELIRMFARVNPRFANPELDRLAAGLDLAAAA